MRNRVARIWPSKSWKYMFISLFLCGGLLMANGFYIKAKGQLAQFLIVYAWDKQQETKEKQAPWPWADTFPAATLSTKGEKALFVLAGANARNLAFGPTLQMNTAHPDQQGNVVIFGHNDTHFAILENTKIGDEFQLATEGGMKRRFQVTDVTIAHETDVQWIDNTNDDRLTLVTCYPFDSMTFSGPLRYIVTAKPVVGKEPHDEFNLPFLYSYNEEDTYWL